MGKRGPKPTPTNMLKLNGSWRAKTRTGEMLPPLEPPASPAWLRPDAHAYWEEWAPRLYSMGLLTQLDGLALGMLCDALASYVEAQRLIESQGTTFTTEKGYVAQHPAVSLRNAALAQVLKLCQEFGLTPSARVGLPGITLPDNDPLAQFLKDGKQQRDKRRLLRLS